MQSRFLLQIDDLVATGGTLLAGANLVRERRRAGRGLLTALPDGALPPLVSSSGLAGVAPPCRAPHSRLHARTASPHALPPPHLPAHCHHARAASKTTTAGKVGGVVVEAAAVIELPDLKGRQKLGDLPLFTLIDVEGE
jgi:hypothetical protein